MLTLEDAKAMYLKCDCSLYAMAREKPDLYIEYKKLNISKAMQEEWRQELFDILTEMLKSKGSINLFHRIYDLAEDGNRYNKERLFTLKKVLGFIKYDNLKVNASVSEAIIGRKALSEKSGMIFWAYDLGECEMAKELVLYAKDLLSYQPMENELRRRFERDIKTCYLIDSELQLGCFN